MSRLKTTTFVMEWIGWLLPVAGVLAVFIAYHFNTGIQSEPPSNFGFARILFSFLGLLGVTGVLLRFILGPAKVHKRRPTAGVITLSYMFFALWLFLFVEEVKLIAVYLDVYEIWLELILIQTRRFCFFVMFLVGLIWWFGYDRGLIRARVRPGPLWAFISFPSETLDTGENLK